MFSQLNNIRADVENLPEHSSLTNVVSSIAFGSVAYMATIIFITDVVLEAILAPISFGLSAILGFILVPILNKFALKFILTDKKIQEITDKIKPELKQNIRQELDKQEELLLKIIEISTGTIETVIKDKADEARILLH